MTWLAKSFRAVCEMFTSRRTLELRRRELERNLHEAGIAWGAAQLTLLAAYERAEQAEKRCAEMEGEHERLTLEVASLRRGNDEWQHITEVCNESMKDLLALVDSYKAFDAAARREAGPYDMPNNSLAVVFRGMRERLQAVSIEYVRLLSLARTARRVEIELSMAESLPACKAAGELLREHVDGVRDLLRVEVKP